MLSAAGLLGLTGASSDGVGICVNALGMLRHDAARPARRARRCAARSSSPRAAAAADVHAVGPARLGAALRRGRRRRRRVSASSAAPVARRCRPTATTRLLPREPPAGERRRRSGRDPRPGPGARARAAARPRSRPAARRSLARRRARDLLGDRTAPICASRADRSAWVTFGAVVAELGDTVTMDVALGPPDETPWLEVELGAVTAAERLAAFAAALRHDDVPAAVREPGRACTCSTRSAAHSRPPRSARDARRAPSRSRQGGVRRGGRDRDARPAAGTGRGARERHADACARLRRHPPARRSATSRPWSRPRPWPWPPRPGRAARSS